MKFHTFGTCAGTQPMPDFHHTCLAVETEKGLYWLDAGECGAYTAHLMGVDLLKTKAIFITHPHMDHVGGLGNLLWYIRKVGIVRKQRQIEGGNIDIFTPCLATVEGTMTLLQNTEGNFQCEYTHTTHLYKEGLIYSSPVEDLKVYATHTDHLPQNEKGDYMSYSFRIEAEGKTVVFSGDMRIEDLERIVPQKTDALFAETGHHQIEDMCNAVKALNREVKKLCFVHNGGYIMRDFPAAEARAAAAFDNNAVVCRDAMTIEI